MTDARLVADATARALLTAVSEGSVGAGVAVDIARRVTDQAATAGVSLDDLLELATRASRV
jgi:hypothetical protein